jgi:hypothetical protein
MGIGIMNASWRGWLIALLLSLFILGCGSEANKGINKDKDKPRPADKTSEKH